MEKKNIKLIGLDLDGTLLDSRKVFTDYSKKVLTEAMRRGVIILPATGRPLTGIPQTVMQFPGVRYALTSNGARLIDTQEDKILYERLLDWEDAKQLLDIFAGYDSYVDIYYEGVGYVTREVLENIRHFVQDPAVIEYFLTTRRPVDDVYEFFRSRKRPLDKVQALFVTQEERMAAWREVREKLPELEVATATSNNVEVNAKGASKGSTLLKLGELLEIRREEIMACGDGINDLDMICKAGFGVAMANAEPAVKEAADYVTVSNEEDGVAKAIERFVL